jgi:hypothetical protein
MLSNEVAAGGRAGGAEAPVNEEFDSGRGGRVRLGIAAIINESRRSPSPGLFTPPVPLLLLGPSISCCYWYCMIERDEGATGADGEQRVLEHKKLQYYGSLSSIHRKSRLQRNGSLIGCCYTASSLWTTQC